jgi:hypothetical protein
MKNNGWIAPKDAEFNEFFVKYCRHGVAPCKGDNPEGPCLPEVSAFAGGVGGRGLIVSFFYP